MTTPNPTTRTHTRKSGETVQITEWTVGAYTLRKSEESGFTGWGVLAVHRDLPRVEDIAGFEEPYEFGVSCSSISDLIPAGAAVYAARIMDAAQAALTFNEIVAAN